MKTLPRSIEQAVEMTDVGLNSVNGGGGLAHTERVPPDVDIQFNGTVCKKVNNGRKLKDHEAFVWLQWGDGDDDKAPCCVFAAITLMANGMSSDINKHVARSFATNRAKSSALVTGLQSLFHARLIAITLSPITLVLQLATLRDFQYMAQNRRQLNQVFAPFIPKPGRQARIDIRIKLVRNPSLEMLRSEVCEGRSTESSPRIHDVTHESLLEELIEQRFEDITSEIARQHEMLALGQQKRNEQQDKISAMLQLLRDKVSHGKHQSCTDELDDDFLDSKKENTTYVKEDVGFKIPPPVPEKPPRSHTSLKTITPTTTSLSAKGKPVKHPTLETFVYPRSINDYKTNKGFEFGIGRLHYTCQYERFIDDGGTQWFKRRVDYELTNGDHEETFSRIHEYTDTDKTVPSIFEDLPHGLVPVSSEAEPLQLMDYLPIYRNPSDLEKLLLRADIGITKETIPELESQPSARCTLDYLREMNGGRDPVWRMVDRALEDIDASPEGPRCSTGLDTILCLDNTSSKANFQKLKEAALKFVNGIEYIAKEYSLMENIAVISLGSKAAIHHHLSTDYETIKATIGGVLCLGPRLRLPQRLIIFTDGLTTDRLARCKLFVRDLSSSFVRRNIFDPVVVVPHTSQQEAMYQSVSSWNASLVNDVTSLLDRQRIYRQSAQIIQHVASQCGISPVTAMSLDLMIATLTVGFKAATKAEIRKIVEMKMDVGKMCLRDSTSFDNINEECGLPPLGSRVERGPDWKWNNEDSECAGTVVNHDPSKETIWVCWDNMHCNVYRYGQNGNYDVLVTDTRPRLAREGWLDLGTEVERGPNWHESYGNQDGGPGNYGRIIRFNVGRVMVRWSNGNIHEYRFDENGKYDLIARGETTPNSEG